MSHHNPARTLRRASLIAAAALTLAAAPAGAVDPVFDSLDSPSGPTANNPSSSARNILREAERSPSLTERFGLPRFGGPIPPIFAPPPPQPILDTPGKALPPPPPLAPNRARRPAPDG